MKDPQTHGIVAGGHARALAAWRPHVEYEVRSRHAEALAGASPDERRRIEWMIEREIEARLDEVAPPRACY